MKITLLIAAIFILLGFVFWKDINGFVQPRADPGKEKNGKKKKKNHDGSESSSVHIINTWNLPSELKEVSGIVYLDNNRFACVQDEEGSIFIYNTSSKKIEKKIPFGEPGDYEDITVQGHMAYVVRADGTLFQVDMKGGGGAAQKFDTPLSVLQNIVGLCLDKRNNRLLMAVKDGDPVNKDFKAIYGFDLAKKTLLKDPVYKIDLADDGNLASKERKNMFSPSAIAIHPETNDIYITDGPKARLLIMNNTGQIKKLHKLGKEFQQPEGITFSPQGTLFISNEGNKEAGNIMQVEVQ